MADAAGSGGVGGSDVLDASAAPPADSAVAVAASAGAGGDAPLPPPPTLLPEGVQKWVQREGGGSALREGTVIRVLYTGRLADDGGRVFDSTDWRAGAPLQVEVGSPSLIRGWGIALASMKAGERARFVIPPAVGYGDAGAGPVPPGATLDFDIEVVDVVDWPAAAAPAAAGAAARYLADARKLKEHANDRLRTGDTLGALYKYKQALQFLDLVAAAADVHTLTPEHHGERAALTVSLHANLSQVNLRLARWSDALEECHAVLAVEPTHEKTLYRIARAYQGAGNIDAAVDSVRRLLQVYPANDDAAALLAALLAPPPPPPPPPATTATTTEAATTEATTPAAPAPIAPAPAPVAPAAPAATPPTSEAAAREPRKRPTSLLAAAAKKTFTTEGGLYADMPGYDKPLTAAAAARHAAAPWYRRLAASVASVMCCPCRVTCKRDGDAHTKSS